MWWFCIQVSPNKQTGFKMDWASVSGGEQAPASRKSGQQYSNAHSGFCLFFCLFLLSGNCILPSVFFHVWTNNWAYSWSDCMPMERLALYQKTILLYINLLQSKQGWCIPLMFLCSVLIFFLSSKYTVLIAVLSPITWMHVLYQENWNGWCTFALWNTWFG